MGRVKKSLLTASSIAALSLSLGCEPTPEGVPLYGECSRPVEEISEELLKYKEEERCVSTDKVRDCSDPDDLFVIYENTAVQEHTSCLAGFITESFADEGLAYQKNKGAELVIVPAEDYPDYSINRGNGVTLGDGVTIVLPNSFQTDRFYRIVNHEIGHTIQKGREEFLSIFHGHYSDFKAYQQDSEYGSFAFMQMFDYWPEEKDSNLTPYDSMYFKGAMLFPGLTLKYGGNMEAAMDEIVHADVLKLETIVDSLRKDLSGNLEDQYYQLWKELLSSENFRSELQSHLNAREAEELMEFLKIRNLEIYSQNFDNSHPRRSELFESAEAFALDNRFRNPFFKAYFSLLASDRLFNQLAKKKPKDYDDRFALSGRILELLEAYPCSDKIGDSETFDPYRCPQGWGEMGLRDPLPIHIYAYLERLYSVLLMKENDPELKKVRSKIAAQAVVDYINRFYPGANFEKGDFAALKVDKEATDQETNEDSLSWGQRTNNLLPHMAYFSSQWAGDKYKSELFLRAAVAVECLDEHLVSHIPSIDSFSTCRDFQERARKRLHSNY